MLKNKLNYVISNGLEIPKDKYFRIIDKIKNENVLIDREFIYLDTGEKLKIEYSDNFTLVMRIIL